MKTPTQDTTFIAVVEHVIWLAGGRGDNLRVVEAYLNRLPAQTVLKLQTLMYFGRGDDTDLRRLHAYLRENTDDKSDAVQTICEKLLALSEYLARAVKIADKRIDLESDFASLKRVPR